MKIAICDDCRQDALHLQDMLNGMHDTKIYADAEHLLADVKEDRMHYDLYLLDIYLEVMDGIELARELRHLDEYGAVCFISSSDAFYRDAYDVYALQYLLKPVQPEDMNRLLERVSRSLARNKEMSLYFKWRGKIGAIPYNKILYISSRAHTLFIHCEDGSIQECVGRLDEIADRVSDSVFCRCHQSYLVNIYCVDNLEGNELVVKGQGIPVSRRYFADVKKRYQEILFEEMD